MPDAYSLFTEYEVRWHVMRNISHTFNFNSFKRHPPARPTCTLQTYPLALGFNLALLLVLLCTMDNRRRSPAGSTWLLVSQPAMHGWVVRRSSQGSTELGWRSDDGRHLAPGTSTTLEDWKNVAEYYLGKRYLADGSSISTRPQADVTPNR